MPSQTNIYWLWLMAWRDSRRNISRLLLFVSSIILGIAALVAINSFGDNLRADIDDEAKELLGADMMIDGRQPPSGEVKAVMDSVQNISIAQAREISFASMIYFPKNKGTRLANVRALDGGFPFYGELETLPLGVGQTFQEQAKAVVDQTLLLQFGADAGDSVKVGQVFFPIAGSLQKAPGQNNIASTVAPKVYIPMAYLEKTNLVKKGSRLIYRYYYQFPRGYDAEALRDAIKTRLRKENYDVDTVENRKRSLNRAFAFLTSFLNLVAFVALLLGCVGVASAVQIYMKEKLNTVAVLRCLGASGAQAFWIYLIQVMVMGFLGSVIGAALGSTIQVLLPEVLKDFLPLEVSYSVSWQAVGEGILIGLIISLLFALLPLVGIRRISPLRTLRAAFGEGENQQDRLAYLVYAVIVAFVYTFSYIQIQNWREAAYFTGFLIFAFFVLAGAARLLMWAVRRFFPTSWSYIWRQGLANLYRPNNQTIILIITVGLGTALMSTLFFIQGILLGQVALSDQNNQPNMVLFDIQRDQTASVEKMVQEFGFPIKQELPIVAMRLSEYRGKTRNEWLEDSVENLPRDVLNREYRVTYRDSLDINEELIEGKLPTPVTSPDDTVFVTVSESHAQRMRTRVGDKIIFNVQGTPVTTYISGVRKLDLTRFRTSFSFVFPTGVLEEAPQFYVLITRVDSNEESAKFQQALIQEFPNISVVDISLVLKTAEEILDEVSFVIRFMALFSILTGIIVLIGSVIISKYQRIQESVLLRTMGANRRQIILITALEYFFLGSLASLAGIVLSIVASWALSYFVFEIDFNPDYTPVIFIYLIITALTVLIGMLNIRGVLRKPPLEVLRSEI